MAKPKPPVEEPTVGERVAATLAGVRAQRIREAYARKPQPTMEQVALEVGCCLKTVWNCLNDRSHPRTHSSGS